MKTLLLKDLRILGPLLVAGTLLVAVPYLIAGVRTLGPDDLQTYLPASSVQAMALCCLVIPFWSGHIIVAERTSNADKFLACLAIKRTAAILSKLIVAVIPSVLLAAANIVAVYTAHKAIYQAPRFIDPNAAFFDITFQAALHQPTSLLFSFAAMVCPPCSFAAAWLCSAWFKRPLLGLVTGVLANAVAVLAWATYLFNIQEETRVFHAAIRFSIFMSIVSLIAIVIGCLILLRRSDA